MDFPLLPLAVRLARTVRLGWRPLSREAAASIEYNAGARGKAEMIAALFQKRRSAAQRRSAAGIGDRRDRSRGSIQAQKSPGRCRGF
jgi:hypothetical protein